MVPCGGAVGDCHRGAAAHAPDAAHQVSLMHTPVHLHSPCYVGLLTLCEQDHVFRVSGSVLASSVLQHLSEPCFVPLHAILHTSSPQPLSLLWPAGMQWLSDKSQPRATTP